MAEHVVLVVGAMGAGKTTAIESLSEIKMVRTEANNTERDRVDKATTTVALDYGEITLSETDKLRLYGVPGQRRFDFMWKILKQRAVGLLILVKNDNPDPRAELVEYLQEFGDIYHRGGIVVRITHTDVSPRPSLTDYKNFLDEKYPGILAPVFTVDPREAHSMTTMLMALAANVDARQVLGANN